MSYVNLTVRGIPYGKLKSRGDKGAPKRWSERVREQTKDLPRVKDACMLKVTFLLPTDKYPEDLPYGPDLDNLLKCFLDALNQTVFSETQGGDSCVVAMTVLKTRVGSRDEAGVHLEIMPVSMR